MTLFFVVFWALAVLGVGVVVWAVLEHAATRVAMRGIETFVEAEGKIRRVRCGRDVISKLLRRLSL